MNNIDKVYLDSTSSLKEYCEKLGSKEQTPGGGSASGLVLSLAASCAEKAARFSIDDYLDGYIDSFLSIKENGFIYTKKDQEAFLNWMDSRKLPKSTEEEIKYREEKIQFYVKESISIPLEIIKNCIKLIEIIQDFIPYCNKWLISDLASAVAFAKSSFESSCFNIKINIPYIKDNDFILEVHSFIRKNKRYFNKVSKNCIKECYKKLKN